MKTKKTTTVDIKILRDRLSMTQVEFAAAVGVDPVSVSRWERGTKPSRMARRQIDDLKLDPERRSRIESGAADLIAAEMTLQQLRRARQLTQKRLAESMGLSQDNVSRIEKRSDLMLSTLRSYVEAMGGGLHLTVTFPKHRTIELSGFSDD